ncbi:hypothetical protein [Cyclobacterium plantarum]|uniref:hypothetical protein n=1 Tax=Cyclobacterium plantarum TaxID=2716263 RepID=UPI003F6FB6A8
MKNAALLFLATALVACNSLENKLEGGWVVDQAYYHDEPVLWDLYSNGFDLRSDHSCHLPIYNWDDRNTVKQTGIWTAFEEKGKMYLRIKTENRIFNREFEVTNLRKVQDTVSFGYLMKMTIQADSLKMDCTKAINE